MVSFIVSINLHFLGGDKMAILNMIGNVMTAIHRCMDSIITTDMDTIVLCVVCSLCVGYAMRMFQEN